MSLADLLGRNSLQQGQVGPPTLSMPQPQPQGQAQMQGQPNILQALMSMIGNAGQAVGNVAGNVPYAMQKADWGNILPTVATGAAVGSSVPAAMAYNNIRAENMAKDKAKQDRIFNLMEKGYLPAKLTDEGAIPLPQKTDDIEALKKIGDAMSSKDLMEIKIKMDTLGMNTTKINEMIRHNKAMEDAAKGKGGKSSPFQQKQEFEISSAMKNLDRFTNELFKPGKQGQLEFTGALPKVSNMITGTPTTQFNYWLGKGGKSPAGKEVSIGPLIKDLDAFKQDITKMSDVGAITEGDREVIGGLINQIKNGSPDEKKSALNRIRLRLQARQDALNEAKQSQSMGTQNSNRSEIYDPEGLLGD